MKSKKAISVFLVLVLSIQLLPLKQIVSWLLSGQVTEEIVHARDNSKNTGGPDEISKHFSIHQYSIANNALICSLMAAHHKAEMLVLRHADDILSPPPNC